MRKPRIIEKPRNVGVFVRLDNETYKKLEDLAKRYDIGISTVVYLACRYALRDDYEFSIFIAEKIHEAKR